LSDLAAFGRLIRVGWVLVRADALAPREIEPILPPTARVAAGFLRLFAGPQAKAGRPGERLALALEHLGPAAIKLGQLLSTRADIFGEVFAQDLSRLKDQLEPFDTALAMIEVARALGRPTDSLFAAFEGPVAAASIAQAHPAVLNDGRKVAVKVLRPDIELRVARDAAALRLAARIVEAVAPPARRLEPQALVETVVDSLKLELDLRMEAGAASELREVMARDGYIAAPAVVWEGVGKRVLTLEWARGMPLSDPAALIQPGLDRPALATKLIRAFLAQALDHGVFHADLHEGNLFVGPPAELTAVDFGIVGRLGAGERRYLAQILYGFISRDYRRIAQVHFDAGYVPPHHSVDAFAQALRAVGEPIFGRTVADVSMGRLLTQLFEITALFDMRLRPELVMLQKTMVAVEGVARRLDPDHDIWDAADPVVRRYIARELSPVNRSKELVVEAVQALKAIARRLEEPPVAPVVITPRRPSRLLWFLLGALALVAAVLIWPYAG
jgi:ubiquinone biosynthesis protein